MFDTAASEPNCSPWDRDFSKLNLDRGSCRGSWWQLVWWKRRLAQHKQIKWPSWSWEMFMLSPFFYVVSVWWRDQRLNDCCSPAVSPSTQDVLHGKSPDCEVVLKFAPTSTRLCLYVSRCPLHTPVHHGGHQAEKSSASHQIPASKTAPQLSTALPPPGAFVCTALPSMSVSWKVFREEIEHTPPRSSKHSWNCVPMLPVSVRSLLPRLISAKQTMWVDTAAVAGSCWTVTMIRLQTMFWWVIPSMEYQYDILKPSHCSNQLRQIAQLFIMY